MSDENRLFALRQKWESAHVALANARSNREDRLAAGLLAGVPCAVIFGLMTAVMSVTHAPSVLFIANGLLAAAALAILVRGFIPSNAEKVAEAAEASALAEYTSALRTEMTAFGIDVSTVVEHSDLIQPVYSFTALRNGIASDISIKDFSGDIIFMMNGERMRKSAAV
jgi:hypothetical protein